jgi:hypothetical protein
MNYVRTATIELKCCGTKHHNPNHILGLGGVMRFITLDGYRVSNLVHLCHFKGIICNMHSVVHYSENITILAPNITTAMLLVNKYKIHRYDIPTLNAIGNIYQFVYYLY